MILSVDNLRTSFFLNKKFFFARILISVIGVLFISSSALAETFKINSQKIPSWKSISPDLETTEISISKQSLFSFNLSLVRTSLKKFMVRVLAAENSTGSRARTLCEMRHANVCINANFFDEKGQPLGLVKSAGRVIKPLHTGGSLLNGLFVASNNAYKIVPRSAELLKDSREAVQSGPLLILGGKKRSSIRNPTAESNRAGVCVDNKGRLVFFCSSATFGGLTIPELQSILLKEGVNCVDALNFDGGGSAQLYVRAPEAKSSSNSARSIQKNRFAIAIDGRDNVPVMLALEEVKP